MSEELDNLLPPEGEKKEIDPKTQGLIDAIAEERAKRREAEEKQRAAEAKLEELASLNETSVHGSEDLQPELSTQEGWVNLIDKKSSDAVKPLAAEVDSIKKSHRAKAEKRFLDNHPEFADESRKKQLLETYARIKSRSDIDSDDIYEDLKDAWAVVSRNEIEKKDEQWRQARLSTEQDTAEIAASGGATYEKAAQEDYGASAEDYRVAKSIGKSIGEYMKLKKQLEDTTVMQ